MDMINNFLVSTLCYRFPYDLSKEKKEQKKEKKKKRKPKKEKTIDIKKVAEE